MLFVSIQVAAYSGGAQRRQRHRARCVARRAAVELTDEQRRDANWLETSLNAAVEEEEFARATELRNALRSLLGDNGATGDWFSLGVPAWLADRAERLGFARPTEVQRRVLPVANAGRSVVLRSGTGSGKTLSFLLPLIANLDFAQRALPQAIVVVPSRELGVQTALLAWRLLGGGSPARAPGDSANMYTYRGPQGVRVRGLFSAADVERAAGRGWLEGCSVVVGTPAALGRAVACGALSTARLAAVAVDEADVSLPSEALLAAEQAGCVAAPPADIIPYIPTWEQPGWKEDAEGEVDVEEPVESALAPPPLQPHECLSLWRASRAAAEPMHVLLAGATLPDSCISAARWAGLLSGPEEAVRVSLGIPSFLPPLLRHRLILLPPPPPAEEAAPDATRFGFAALARLIRADAAAATAVGPSGTSPRTIVFFADEEAAAAAAPALRAALWGLHTIAVLLPGGAEPTRAQHAFRDGAASLLLATPEAERGMDWPAVRHVYTAAGAAPGATAYLHRAGRAGRLGDGGGGTITTLVQPAEVAAARSVLAELGVSNAEELDSRMLVPDEAGSDSLAAAMRRLEDLYTVF